MLYSSFQNSLSFELLPMSLPLGHLNLVKTVFFHKFGFEFFWMTYKHLNGVSVNHIFNLNDNINILYLFVLPSCLLASSLFGLSFFALCEWWHITDRLLSNMWYMFGS